jgi:hypothetical protein
VSDTSCCRNKFKIILYSTVKYKNGENSVIRGFLALGSNERTIFLVGEEKVGPPV